MQLCWKCLLLQKSKNTIDQFLAKSQSRLSYETTGNLFISVFSCRDQLYAVPQCYKWPVFIDCQCLYLFQSFVHQVHLSPSEFIFSFSKRKAVLVALRACLIHAWFVWKCVVSLLCVVRKGVCNIIVLHRNAQAVASPTILHHTRLLVNLQARFIVLLKSFSGVHLYLLQRRF